MPWAWACDGGWEQAIVWLYSSHRRSSLSHRHQQDTCDSQRESNRSLVWTRNWTLRNWFDALVFTFNNKSKRKTKHRYLFINLMYTHYSREIYATGTVGAVCKNSTFPGNQHTASVCRISCLLRNCLRCVSASNKAALAVMAPMQWPELVYSY